MKSGTKEQSMVKDIFKEKTREMRDEKLKDLLRYWVIKIEIKPISNLGGHPKKMIDFKILLNLCRHFFWVNTLF